VAPKWRRHILRILEREPGIDAALFLSVPPNHLRGVAAAVKHARGIPMLFFDGDVPASLPQFQGFATGFRIYDGANLSEYDAVICNSDGGGDALRSMGARAVHTLHYAADPDLYTPVDVPQDIDVFFYGHTAEYRADWIQAMIAGPSAAMPETRFAVRGRELGSLGRAELVAEVPFNQLRQFVARSRINLAITRQPHASTHGSSTMRPFELAMMGACIVSNPYCGIERWFEPGREVVVVNSADEVMDRYRFLLAHDAERKRLGAAARRRALSEHTFRHRAAELVSILERYA
jgi:spore maturation protein CgeB